jgi:hypothetical protein
MRIGNFVGSIMGPTYSIFQSIYNRISLLFQQIIKSFTPNPPSLEGRVTFGGVENAGNTCIFSVMLQDFAALPKYYDAFIYGSLLQGEGEDAAHFDKRKEVQKLLQRSIQAIRRGSTVKKEEVQKLAHFLQGLGWEGSLPSLWRRFLHLVAPCLFPIPEFSVFKLFEKTIGVLTHSIFESRSAASIVFLSGADVENAISTFLSREESVNHQALWRIATEPGKPILEEVKVGKRTFTLRLAHAEKKGRFGNHVVVYRKGERGWLCCDDTRITAIKELPLHSIYSLVYTG